MYITVLGIFIVPFSLLWALNPVRLLQFAMIVGIFEAAASVVVGSFGLQPAMVPGLLFIAYIIAQYALGMRYPGEKAVFSIMLPMLGFLFYALLSIWVLPQIFQGTVFVWPQKPDPFAPGAVPLVFNSGNITQSLYLTIDILIAVASAIFVTRRSVPYQKIIRAYMIGGYAVIVLVFWQFAHNMGGVWYPDDVLHSNPGWQIVDQMVGSVPRMQGPFSEPSALAYYLSGVAFCCLWLSIRGYRTMKPNLLLALAIVSVLLSTSTTGIATLAIGLPLVLALASVGGDPGALGRVGKTAGMLVVGGLLVIGPMFILMPRLVDSVNTVVESTLNKGDTESYNDRTATDVGAMATVGETYGLGVGWGSYRSSSLIPGLLANAGVFGLTMVLWQILRLAQAIRRAGSASPGHPGRILVNGFSASLCGQLGAAVLSGPTINSLVFYMQYGCIVGVLARMSAELKPSRATARAGQTLAPRGSMSPEPQFGNYEKWT